MKAITSAGMEVLVSHSIAKQANGLHVIVIRAACGESEDIHSITIGAVDGVRPVPPTTEELQKLVDDKKVEVARHAAWKESVRLALDKLV